MTSPDRPHSSGAAGRRAAIVIPAFNEADTIAAVVAGASRHGLPIVVNDGSTDATAELAKRGGADVVQLPGNRGYEGALDAGFARAAALGVDVAVSFDADGQFSEQALTEVLRPLLSGEASLVLGIRPRAARFGEACFSAYTRLRFGVPDILCGLKGYDMTLYRAHGCLDQSRLIGTELALASLRRGVRPRLVPVVVLPRVGISRFGRALSANARIFRAMFVAILADRRRA